MSTLSFDAMDRLVAIDDPAGRGGLLLGHDSQRRLVSITDWLSSLAAGIQDSRYRQISVRYQRSIRLRTE